MLKAGGIGAAAGFVIALILTLITPLCDPCAALFVGLGVGSTGRLLGAPRHGGRRGAERIRGRRYRDGR